MDLEAFEQWRRASEEGRVRDADFDTLSSEPLEPLYTPADLKDHDFDRDLGYPGSYPYTRGVYPTMYRGRLWTFRQFSGYGNATETNRRYKCLPARGQARLPPAFAMPTLTARHSGALSSRGRGAAGGEGGGVGGAAGLGEGGVGVRQRRAPAEVAIRLSFFFNSHIDFFEEVAKFRAARRIWARWMRNRYGAGDERSLRLRFHTQTAGCSLTAPQPSNNVVRTAYEALAAVPGGTQSLHTNSLDEVLALPTEEAAELALRTQQILAYEPAAPTVIHPLGGSSFVHA